MVKIHLFNQNMEEIKQHNKRVFTLEVESEGRTIQNVSDTQPPFF